MSNYSWEWIKGANTLESGINIAPGTFGKNINIAPWLNVAHSHKTDNLNILKEKKAKKF